MRKIILQREEDGVLKGEAQLAESDQCSVGKWKGVMIDLTNGGSLQRDRTLCRLHLCKSASDVSC